MKIEDQVCSLEHAIRLKELGFEKESFFAYFIIGPYREWHLDRQTNNYIGLPAYTVSELINMLRKYTNEVIIKNIENIPNFLAEMLIEFHEKISKEN